MDVRKNYKLKLIRAKSQQEPVHFVIKEEEVMAIITAAGKPISIYLYDLAGETWCINLSNVYIELDMKINYIELTIGNNKPL